jgi:hypothetical protein
VQNYTSFLAFNLPSLQSFLHGLLTFVQCLDHNFKHGFNPINKVSHVYLHHWNGVPIVEITYFILLVYHLTKNREYDVIWHLHFSNSPLLCANNIHIGEWNPLQHMFYHGFVYLLLLLPSFGTNLENLFNCVHIYHHTFLSNLNKKLFTLVISPNI